MKNKSGLFEKLFYNNKFLAVFSFLLAVVLWATVKINVSDNTTRTISNIKVNIDTSLLDENDFKVFVSEEDLLVDVKVSGKSYNINSYSLSENDVIVEATAGYTDVAGYRVLYLTGRTVDGDVSVTGISPSSVTVFLDREATDTFNVEGRLNNDIENLSDKGYVVGQPVPSMSTVEVSGPATVLERIKKVYFESTVDETELPLTSTKELPAAVSYQTDSERGIQFLTCKALQDEANPATLTIPVYRVKTVATSVKFVNQPKKYEDESPKAKISPSEVEISYNPKDSEEINNLPVGTVDFHLLDNKLNSFEFTLDEKTVGSIINAGQNVFTVTVDMSDMQKKIFEEIPTKVVTLNEDKNYSYSVSLENGGLDEIMIIGSSSSLSKIKAEDLQVEINVSSVDLNKTGKQKVAVSNISISTEGVDDCWIYGTYYADIIVKAK